MAKVKNPFHSFSAHGSIGRVLSVRRRQKEHIAQDFPDHPDANTTPQQAQRLMFQMCRDLWHTLSQGEKAAWESLARPFHMTGYAYYLSQCLRPNPGIYLPLAGGTMQGAINMATNRITALPTPGANSDPARKQEIIDHAALLAAVHGLLGCYAWYAWLPSNQTITPSTFTLVNFTSERFDKGSAYNTSSKRWVAPFNCLVIALCGLEADAPSSVSRYWYCQIRRSGNNRISYRNYYHSYSQRIFWGGLIEMTAGQYLDVYVYTNSSYSEPLFLGASDSYFCGFVIPQSG